MNLVMPDCWTHFESSGQKRKSCAFVFSEVRQRRAMKAGKWFGIASVTGVSHIVSAVESTFQSNRSFPESKMPLLTAPTRREARGLKFRSPLLTRRESNIVEGTLDTNKS